jgi:hypothetical protein
MKSAPSGDIKAAEMQRARKEFRQTYMPEELK